MEPQASRGHPARGVLALLTTALVPLTACGATTTGSATGGGAATRQTKGS
ncbi:hypothetical protein [Streptomyces montanus]|nr:hypothetical protein [Streptomyces montanus]